MRDITTVDELRTAIRELEDQDYVNQQFMKKRVEKIVDDLKPVNLIKGIFRQVIKTPESKPNVFSLLTGGTNVFRFAAGVATSFLVKKMFRKRVG